MPVWIKGIMATAQHRCCLHLIVFVVERSSLSPEIGGLNKKRHAGRAVKFGRSALSLIADNQIYIKPGYPTTAFPFVTPVTGLFLGECFLKGRKELVVGSRGIR
jgi:hypothetical protein